jgi:hypothetical protein
MKYGLEIWDMEWKNFYRVGPLMTSKYIQISKYELDLVEV